MKAARCVRVCWPPIHSSIALHCPAIASVSTWAANAKTSNAIAARLLALALNHGGREFQVFDQIYFNKLRLDENYWYSFAGYFSRSRCAILMTSLPCDRLADLCAAVDSLRARWPAFVWGAATVVCRRGLHGGVLAFYDERSEWPAMQAAIADATRVLRGAGCVPYKSGKLWADEVRASGAYYSVLQRIKRGLDPQGLMSPGNLGL